MRFHTMQQLPQGAPVFMEPRDYLERTLNSCLCASCRRWRHRRGDVSRASTVKTGAFELIGHPLPIEWHEVVDSPIQQSTPAPQQRPGV